MQTTNELKVEYFTLIALSDKLKEKLDNFEASLTEKKPSFEWKIKTEVEIDNTRKELDFINSSLAEIKLMLSRLGEL